MTSFRATRIDASLDTSAADAALVDENGLVRPAPASVLSDIPSDAMRLWCHKRAIYLAPSIELIAWLKDRIGGRSAIEVGAGNGAVGRALGVPITDNRCQEWADVRAYYAMAGQPTVQYPKDVEAISALDAVSKYRPQVVVACWLTEFQLLSSANDGKKLGKVQETSLLLVVEGDDNLEPAVTITLPDED